MITFFDKWSQVIFMVTKQSLKWSSDRMENKQY